MNFESLILEMSVAALALVILLIDLWTAPQSRAKLNYLAAAGLLAVLGLTFIVPSNYAADVQSLMAQDGLALFFQRFFLVAAIFVLLMAGEFSPRLNMGIGEYYVVVLIALTGMMLAAAANDFVLLFVALELISVSFYILISFQRSRLHSLEAGVKYLILSALASSFLVFGIALIFGVSNQTNFVRIHAETASLLRHKVFLLGALLVMVGLGFKIAAVPLQVWAPDVYQGAPTPTTAFLAIGSKAAGFVLVLRVLCLALPGLMMHWDRLLMVAAALTILYGNLCAIPQRNLKRLLGYSSISNAGYLMLGIAALSPSGAAAILYYLAGYLFTLVAAFAVILVVARENDDISSLAGLSQRSPFLAASMTLAMVSLAGVPPLAGFVGKFFLLRAIIEKAGSNHAYFCLAFVAIAGVVISMYYYFGVIRAMYWAKDPSDLSPIVVSAPMRLCLVVSVLGMLYLGLFPDCVWTSATDAIKALKF